MHARVSLGAGGCHGGDGQEAQSVSALKICIIMCLGLCVHVHVHVTVLDSKLLSKALVFQFGASLIEYVAVVQIVRECVDQKWNVKCEVAIRFPLCVCFVSVRLLRFSVCVLCRCYFWLLLVMPFRMPRLIVVKMFHRYAALSRK